MKHTIIVKPETIFLEDLLKETAEGKYKIPIFQRDFVWKTSQMLDLFDSILKGYPIGSLLFWKTKGYDTKDKIGPYRINKPSNDDVKYVLDGFQRISTLFGVLMNPDEFTTDHDNEKKIFSIYFDIKENSFSSVKSTKNKDLYLVPLYEIYDNRKLFDFLRKIDKENIDESSKNEYIENARNLHDLLHKYRLSYVEIQGGDIKSAVEIFSRINSTGTEISEDFMLSALTYNEATGFLLSDSITEFLSSLNHYNFEELKRGVILDCISNTHGMMYEKNKVYFDVKIEDLLNNSNLEEFINKTYKKIQETIKFLYHKLLIIDVRLLPYPAQLIFIAEYFRLNPNPTPQQSEALETWFWTTTYSNYFTLYSLSQQRNAYQVFCEFAKGKHPDGIYKVNPDLPFSTAKYPEKLNFTGVRPKALRLFYLKSIANQPISEKEGMKDIFIFDKKDKNPANIIVRLSSEFEQNPEFKKVDNFINQSCPEILEQHFITQEMINLYKAQAIQKFILKRDEYLKLKEKEFVQSLGIEFIED